MLFKQNCYKNKSEFLFHQANPELVYTPIEKREELFKVVDKNGDESRFFPSFFNPETNEYIYYAKYRLNRYTSRKEANKGLRDRLILNYPFISDSQVYMAENYNFNWSHSYKYHGLVSNYLLDIGINYKVVFADTCKITSKPRNTCDVYHLSNKNITWRFASEYNK